MLPPEEMRAFGQWVVEQLLDHLAELPELPAAQREPAEKMRRRLEEPPPSAPRPWQEVLQRLERDVLPAVMLTTHPRFFAFVPSPSNFASVMADALASGLNAFAGTWAEASGPAQLELTTLGWLRELLSLAPTSAGVFLSGGSMANLTALAVARQARAGERLDQAVAYCSDQTHSSVERALRLLGLSSAHIVRLPSDDGFRLSPAEVASRIAADRRDGLRPFCVVANAGTINTGAVDPLEKLAELCRAEDLWLHVDGAYGAAAALSPQARARLWGLGLADSLTVDPHKWLFQPYGIGCCFVREGRLLEETFRVNPEYLRDLEPRAGEVNFCDLGPELTRPFRALKLWMTIQIFGMDELVAAIERGLSLAERAEALLRERGFEMVTAAQLGVLTFRYAPEGLPMVALDRLQERIAAAVAEDGLAIVQTTVLRGRTVLRMCTINPRTEEDDLATTAELLWQLGEEAHRRG